jgi:serine/threonine protein kinase
MTDFENTVTKTLVEQNAENAGEFCSLDHISNKDPHFKELIEHYNITLRNRSIPYPVAYQFIKELGHGKQGIVFLVTRYGARGCLTHHALKLFDPQIYSDSEKYFTDMGRIAKQISVLQPINNINLVSRDYYDEHDSIGYIVMQPVDGIDLRSLVSPRYLELAKSRSTAQEWKHFTKVIVSIKNGRVCLQPGLSLYIMRNVLRGLSALHQKGFVHGDVKPTNIMIDIQGTVKLVDFGRATRIGEPVKILLGSPLYMAPELHKRQPAQIQSDLFSVGLVSLEMLAGTQVLPDANSTEKQLYAYKTGLLPRLKTLVPGKVVRNFQFIQALEGFLAPDVAKRFSNIKETETGKTSLVGTRQSLAGPERETEYERELEKYLAKFVDPQTGTLNPHFASDNITAFIIS